MEFWEFFLGFLRFFALFSKLLSARGCGETPESMTSTKTLEPEIMGFLYQHDCSTTGYRTDTMVACLLRIHTAHVADTMVGEPLGSGTMVRECRVPWRR